MRFRKKKFLSPYFSKNMCTKAVQNCKTFMCEFYILRLPKSCLKLWYVAERRKKRNSIEKIQLHFFFMLSSLLLSGPDFIYYQSTGKFKIISCTTKNQTKEWIVDIFTRLNKVYMYIYFEVNQFFYWIFSVCR